MSDFLATVLAQKQREIAADKQARPAAELAPVAAADPVRDFAAAITPPGNIIAEIKRRSPSVAAFRQDGPVAELAGIYAAGGAAAISIVTDAANFGTSLNDVGRVRQEVDLPVLVKDFVCDPYQVLAARAAGADCLLLIARILAPADLAALLAEVRLLGMSALVECHDAAEIDRAAAAGADIFGLNSRDLRTLTVSLETTEKLAGLVPDPALCVAESGIDRRADIERLLAAGAGAFLVGGALLNAADPGRKLRQLRGLEPEPEGTDRG